MYRWLYHARLWKIRHEAISRASPSAAAKSAQYNEIQGPDSSLLDGRFCKAGGGSDTAAPSIELYHPAFATYIKHANDTNLVLLDQILRKGLLERSYEEFPR